MSFFVYHRSGVSERDPAQHVFGELLSELEENPQDVEHTSVSVVHQSEWGLGCHRGGYVTYEHVEGNGEPRHMTGLSREEVLRLMQYVADGELAKLEEQPWLAGY